MFFDCYSYSLFSGGEIGRWAVSTQIDIFPIFFNFLSLTSFGDSGGNSYTKFIIVDIKIRFTCGDLDLY